METKQLGITRGSIIQQVKAHELQVELFKRIGLMATSVERSEFVLKESALEAIDRGEAVSLEDLGNYKLVTRTRPISVFETSDGYRSIAGVSNFSYSQKRAGMGEMSRDEVKLFKTGQMVCSVELHETTAFASGI